jgi:3-(3-hydroxy-phenyl)propionate hydroxylase
MCCLFLLPGGWRIDLQLFDEDDPAEYSGVEGVRKWLPKVMDAKYAERITWVSTYQFLQVVAKDFTDARRRVLLAGEPRICLLRLVPGV